MTPIPRRRGAALALVALLVATFGCSQAEPPERPAEEVLADHNPVLLEMPGVMGTGVTDWQEREVILILVESKSDPAVEELPESLEGHPVFVVDRAEVEAWTGLKMP